MIGGDHVAPPSVERMTATLVAARRLLPLPPLVWIRLKPSTRTPQPVRRSERRSGSRSSGSAARIEDRAALAPRLAAVGRLREHRGAPEGRRDVEGAGVGVLARRDEPVPDGVGDGRRDRVGRHRFLVVQHRRRCVEARRHRRLPRLTAVERAADDDRARTAEGGAVRVERVGDRVDDLPVGRVAEPGVGRPVEEARRARGRSLADRERRLARGQVPACAAVIGHDDDVAVRAAVIPAVLLEHGDEVARVGGVDRDVRLDLGVRVVDAAGRGGRGDPGRARGRRAGQRHVRRAHERARREGGRRRDRGGDERCEGAREHQREPTAVNDFHLDLLESMKERCRRRTCTQERCRINPRGEARPAGAASHPASAVPELRLAALQSPIERRARLLTGAGSTRRLISRARRSPRPR